jgi:RNA polymerase sigma-70 factor, ECF subfamily
MSALLRGIGAPGFDRLYRRHAAGVYRYVYAVLGNHADAEDVTQQTFLNAYRAMAQGTKPRKAENWLVTIAHNEVRRHLRKTHGRPMEVELDEQFADLAPDGGDPSLADVLRALQHLPPSQRAALVRREFEGRSYAEIAEILEVTPDALEGLLFRARRGLAEQLEGALTCGEAENVLLRRLDGRLPRPESRRLNEHLRECPACVRFSTVQKRQRSLLKGLSVLPIPASLYLFRGERAALAATGVGPATATGGTVAVGGGGFAAATGAVGLAAKAAAVAASAAVVGGVGYGVSTGSATISKTERRASHVAAVEQTRVGRRAAEVQAALSRGERPGPARPASARAHRNASKPKRPTSLRAAGKLIREDKQTAGRAHRRAATAPTKPRLAERKARRPAASRPAAPRERAEEPTRRGSPATKRPRLAQSRREPAAQKQVEPEEAATPRGNRGLDQPLK